MTILAVYNVDEGSGTTLTDSSGNGHDATLDTGDSVSWWNDAAPMVSQAVGDMDLAHGFFTDKAYHALPMHQSAIDELGVELIENSDFSDGTTSWTTTGELSGSSVELDINEYAFQDSVAYIVGQQYEFTIAGTGDVKVRGGYAGAAGDYTNITLPGSVILTADSDFNRAQVTATSFASVSSFSVREVNPVINANDQYFRKSCAGSNPEYFFYKDVLTGEDLLTVETACCLI